MARRRRNRKKKVDGYVIPVPFASFAVIVAVFALAYLWLGSRCELLGREIKKAESAKKFLVKRYLNEEYRWSRMKSPRNLERVLKEKGIEMRYPRRDQVVRLYDAGEYRNGYAKLDRVVMNE